MTGIQLWPAGSTVVLQEVWRGRLWSARPMTVVRDEGRSVALWCPRGTRWKTATTPPTRPRAATRGERFAASLALCDWVLGDFTWEVSTLRLMQEGDWHAVWVSWLDTGEHWGWYVNLQEPFRRVPPGFQTMDLMLDVVVERDGRWRLKDEDELRLLVREKVFERWVARRVRAEARRVVGRVEHREPPFGDPWPAWRPDPSWALPELPDACDGLQSPADPRT